MVGGVRGRVSDRLAVVVRLQVVEAVVSRKDGKLNRRVGATAEILGGVRCDARSVKTVVIVVATGGGPGYLS
jgi:hypothetical protein